MKSFWQDVRHSVRRLVRSPGRAAAAIVTLAVGLGATTAVFSVVKGVLLEALPYGEPDRLVDVSLVFPPGEGRPERESGVDFTSFTLWRESARTFEEMATYRRASFVLEERGHPVRLEGAAVSRSFFSLLRVPPAEGRTFDASDEGPEVSRPVVLSHGLWQRRFQGRGDVVGRIVQLDGVAHQVVGVMPASFFFPDSGVELWTAIDERLTTGAAPIDVAYLPVVGRLEEGVELTQATEEAQAVLSRLATEAGPAGLEWKDGTQVRVLPLHRRMVGAVENALETLTGAVALVLMLAWVNVATLLLAQCAWRRREFAVRVAIGGGRVRLLRQLLTESMVLSLLGGAGALLGAFWLERILPLAAIDLPRVDQVELDGAVYAFAFGLACLTGLILGLLTSFEVFASPGFRAAPLRASPRVWRGRSMGTFVIVEVALAVLLLVNSGILLRSFLHLLDVELGYEPAGVVTTELRMEPGSLGEAGWSGVPLDELLQRLDRHPGVQAAGVVSVPPFPRSYPLVSVGIEGLPPGRRLAVPQMTSPDYLEAVGMRLLEGRSLTPEDHFGRAPVVLVNEAFAARHLAGERAVGKRLRVGSESLEIVGVVEDARLLGLESNPRPEFFVGYHLAGRVLASSAETLTLAVRRDPGAAGVVEFLRGAVHELFPAMPVEVRTMEAQLAGSVARPRFYTTALGLLAGIALLLACTGLYGVLSHSVSTRTREIGIRASLGARGSQIVGMFLVKGLVLLLAGLVIGGGAAFASSRLLTRLWGSVVPLDPAPYWGAALVLLAVGTLASIVPAYRAKAVDPTEALRRDSA